MEKDNGEKKKEIKELTDAQKERKKKNVFYKAKKNLSEKVTHSSASPTMALREPPKSSSRLVLFVLFLFVFFGPSFWLFSLTSLARL